MSTLATHPDHAIDVVIPALNEERSICDVLDAVPRWVRRIVVVDNGSTDSTALAARSRNAHVVHEPRRGYGAACLRGLAQLNDPDIVVFVDADRSDHPEEMDRLVQPIIDDAADLVIGSRVLGNAEPGSLTLPQRFGNRLASALIRSIWGANCTDLGPFRAIRFDALQHLRMTDLDYGWTVQMQVRAARLKLRMIEIPVSYRKRIGISKISGTVRGVIGAGTKILGTIIRESIQGRKDDEPSKRLVVFSRLPSEGTTKTRLIPALGEQAAAELQRKMTQHTLDVARRWRDHTKAAIEVRFTGGHTDEMQSVFGTDVRYVEQGDGSLGIRLQRAFRDGRGATDQHIITIGSDCPSITPLVLRRAFAALGTHDVVIGPATDGGYYLIGLRRPQPRLFHEIDWGSETVFEQTMSRCRAAGLRVATLEPLSDVDEPEDLPVWESIAAQREDRMLAPALSVIIPTLNEAEHLEATIHSIGSRSDTEVIVADGGSSDATIDIADRCGALIVTGTRGRGAQLNAGAAVARGDVLLFLHADTRLPFDYRAEVDRVLARPNVVAGAFRFALDHVTIWLRLIEFGTNLRSRLRQLPYGDQAIFLPRSLLGRIGGFKPWTVMEDFEFIRRLRRHGRVGIAQSAVITSARRWRRNGPWRTTLRHQLALARFLLGQSPDRIRGLVGQASDSQRDRIFHPFDFGDELPPKTLGMGIRAGDFTAFVTQKRAMRGRVTVETPRGKVIVSANESGFTIHESPESVQTVQTFFHSWSAFYRDSRILKAEGEGKAGEDS